MKVRYGRVISCLVVSAVVSTALPQFAYAAPASGKDDDKGIVDTLKGWLGDDDGGKLDKPPSHDELDVADRQKLPKGRTAPTAVRVRELTGRRTSRGFRPSSSTRWRRSRIATSGSRRATR